MLIAARNVCTAEKKTLPYLKRVEWIGKSETGTFSLPIPYSMSNNSSFSLKIQSAYRSGATINYLGTKVTTCVAYRYINGKWQIILFVASTTIANTSLTPSDDIYTIRLDTSAKTFALNSSSTSYTGSILTSPDIDLFHNGNDATARLYSFRATDNSSGANVIDIFPVIDKQGVACIYDSVTGRCFYNEGTGAFVAGPDAISAGGGGYKLICTRRSYTRFSRPSRRFCTRRLRPTFLSLERRAA